MKIEESSSFKRLEEKNKEVKIKESEEIEKIINNSKLIEQLYYKFLQMMEEGKKKAYIG